MDKRTTDIVAYLTWVGLIVAFVAGDKQNSKFHLNQALVIWGLSLIISILSGILSGAFSLVFKVADIFLFVCAIIGLVNAFQGVEKPLPLIGSIKIIK